MATAAASTGLSALREATGASVLAHQRHLPVSAAWAELLPDAGLVRGRVVGCAGGSATSVALSLVAEPTRRGSWLAVVGVPHLGIEAAAAAGVALERTVVVGADARGAERWGELVGAAIDGFELVLTREPVGGEQVVRRVRQRARSRGVVLVTLRPTRSTDLTVRADPVAWEGIGAGHGHLRARRTAIEVAGRRTGRVVREQMWCPDPTGGTTLVDHVGSVESVVPIDGDARPSDAAEVSVSVGVGQIGA